MSERVFERANGITAPKAHWCTSVGLRIASPIVGWCTNEPDVGRGRLPNHSMASLARNGAAAYGTAWRRCSSVTAGGSRSPTTSSGSGCVRSPSGWSRSASSAATGWPCSPTRASSSPSPTSPSAPLGRSWCRCTRRTPPTSASGWSATRRAASSSARTPRQVAKVDSVRANLPDLEHVVVIDGEVAGAMTLDELGARGAGGDQGELDRRIAAVCRRRRLPHHLHVRHHRAPQGRAAHATVASPPAARRPGTCSCSVAATRCTSTCRWRTSSGRSARPPPSRSAGRWRSGAAIANQIIAEMGQVHPTVLPSVPRIFEKVYALAMAFIPPEQPPTPRPPPSRSGCAVRDVGVHRRDVHRGGTGGVRSGRCRDVLAGARDLRWQHQAGGLRRRADRARHPALLLRRRRPGDGGMGDDRDDGDRDAQPARAPIASAASAGPSPAPTSASPTTARSRWPARC